MNLIEVKAIIKRGDPVKFRAKAKSNDIDLVIGNMIPLEAAKERSAEMFDFTYLDARMFFYQISPVADIWSEEVAE